MLLLMKKKPTSQNVNDKINYMVAEYIILTEIPVQAKGEAGQRTVNFIRDSRMRPKCCGELLKGQFRNMKFAVIEDIWNIIKLPSRIQ